MTISFSLHLPNRIGQRGTRRFPWFSKYWRGRISENKSWEVQTDFWGWGNLLTFDLDISWSHRDHAGLHLEFCLLGFGIYIDANDNRHWDRKNDTWEKYDEESMKADDLVKSKPDV